MPVVRKRILIMRLTGPACATHFRWETRELIERQ